MNIFGEHSDEISLFSKAVYIIDKAICWDFPSVQWLRLMFPMQGAQVRSLVRELDPVYHS